MMGKGKLVLLALALLLWLGAPRKASAQFFGNIGFSKTYLLDPEFWKTQPPKTVKVDPFTRRIYWFDQDAGQVKSAPYDQLNEIFSPKNGNANPPGVVNQPPVPKGKDPRPYADDTLDGHRCENPVDRRDAQHMLKATAQLDLGGEAKCTAFRTSAGTIMTNAHCAAKVVNGEHCYPQRSEYQMSARMMRCANNAMRTAMVGTLRRRVEVKFVINGEPIRVRCTSLVAGNAELDYAAFDCPGMDDRIPVVKISEAGVHEDEQLTIATWDFGDQRGRGGPKRKLRTGRLTGRDRRNYEASMGSQAGNSGSAIFNPSHEVVGLNWGATIGSSEAEIRAYEQAREMGLNPQKPANFHLFKDIMADMRSRFPGPADEITRASNGSGLQCRSEEKRQRQGYYGIPASSVVR